MDTRKPNFLSLVAKATGQRWEWGAQQTLPTGSAAFCRRKSGGGKGKSWAAHLSKAMTEQAIGQCRTHVTNNLGKH